MWRITAYGAGAYGAGPFGGVGFGGGVGGATSHEFPPRFELPCSALVARQLRITTR